ERTKREIPAPSDAAFDMRRRELLEACELFLSEETKWCRTSTPRWFEVPFGRPVEEGKFGSSEPVTIDLGEGGEVMVVGQIDRIDECGTGRFKVWDYKSGSTYGFEDHEYLTKGKKIQHAIYSVATRELLRRAGIAGEVEESGYYFPTRKGRARRIRRVPPFSGDEREALNIVLTGLLDTIHHGSFIHTVEEGDCKFCDFKAVCGGDIKQVAREAKEISKQSTDPGVVAFTRVGEVE
ncbi:MAG: PD-(D/E)XK nuclease family protein, partial [Thermoanaerobaculia bacterium]|nr:PD-(D/E)XK nuclease family protein [Thermoanaerobaculia bacterium]